MNSYEVIKKSLLKYGIPEGYSCYTALNFLEVESKKQLKISDFLGGLASSLSKADSKEEIYNVFDSYWKTVWSKIDKYNQKKYDQNYYYLRILVFLLTLDYDADNLDDYSYWINYFIDNYKNI